MATKRSPRPHNELDGERSSKRCKVRDVTPEDNDPCYIEALSLEVLCKLLQYLSLKDIIKLDSLSQRLREAVSLHLKLLKSLELSENRILGPMPAAITDYSLGYLVNRCPNLEIIRGMFTGTRAVSKCKSNDSISVEGVLEVLASCPNLRALELDNVYLLEGVLLKFPLVKILGSFINHGGSFPIPDNSQFTLSKNPKVRYLHLTGVTIPELPRMDTIIYLYMRWVKFTNPNPFSTLMAPCLHTFVMSNCAGPANALKYVPLVTRLAASRALRRLELVRVPFLGGLFQHVLEDTWKFGAFSSLENITFGACKHATEVDLGHLILTCAEKLFQLIIQPSLTKDNLFLALTMAQVCFPRIETLHLGYVDPFPIQGRWSNEELVEHGLSDVTEHPALITDTGLQMAGKLFSNLRNLIAYNCPYLRNPNKWLVEDGTNLAHLRFLHLHRCHSIQMTELSSLIQELPALESVYLQDMFKEMPKGCAHVGLSAGTAVGVSAAYLANQEPGHRSVYAYLANREPGDSPEVNVCLANQEPGHSLDVNPFLANQEPGHSPPVNPFLANQEPGHSSATNPQPELDDKQPPDSLSGDILTGHLPPVGRVAMDIAAAAGTACVHSSTSDCDSSQEGTDVKDQMMADEIDAMMEQERREEERQKSAKKSASCEPVTKSSIPVAQCSGDGQVRANETETPYEGKGKRSIGGKRYVKRSKGGQKESDKGQGHDNRSDSSSCTPTGNDSGLVSSADGSPSGMCSSVHINTQPRDVLTKPVSEVASASSTSNSSGAESTQIEATQIEATQIEATKIEATQIESTQLKKSVPASTASGTSVKAQCDQMLPDVTAQCDQMLPDVTAQCNQMLPDVTAQCDQMLPDVTAQCDDDMDTDKFVHPSDDDSASSPVRTIGTQTICDVPDDEPDQSEEAASSSRQSCADCEADHAPNRPETNRVGRPLPIYRIGRPGQQVSNKQSLPRSLPVQSRSLVSLTLFMVGVEELQLRDCPQLTTLHLTACRVLRTACVDKCPDLQRVTVAQCPIFDHVPMLSQILAHNPPIKNRFIFLRPMYKFDTGHIEELIFRGDTGCHGYLVRDHSLEPSLTVHNKPRFEETIKVVSLINKSLLGTVYGGDIGRAAIGASTRYPWCRQLSTILGESADGSTWDVVCDIPWLQELYTTPTPLHLLHNISSTEMKKGLYSPSCHGHTMLQNCLKTLREVISEVVECRNQALFEYTTGIYINTCDTSSIPTPDVYV